MCKMVYWTLCEQVGWLVCGGGNLIFVVVVGANASVLGDSRVCVEV